jgi:hypothetical protein
MREKRLRHHPLQLNVSYMSETGDISKVQSSTIFTYYCTSYRYIPRKPPTSCFPVIVIVLSDPNQLEKDSYIA